MYGYDWRPYVPKAQRLAKARKAMAAKAKRGKKIEPITIKGRKIAHAFWAQAWCDQMDTLSDYENRLPRGKTYVRNGSVVHLGISGGDVEAFVAGSELYTVNVTIAPLKKAQWKRFKQQCAGEVGSLLDLLEGRFSQGLMQQVTDSTTGLMPRLQDIKTNCSCPDWASMCKHIAAALYGIGARLDQAPELIFELRGADYEELFDGGVTADLTQATSSGSALSGDLSDIFGIALDTQPEKRQKGKAKNQTKSASESTQANTQKSAKKKAASVAAKKTTKAPQKNKAKITKKATSTPSPSTAPAFTGTAASLRKLRKYFEMNQRQFATLIGASTASVSKWEQASGKLSLRDSSTAAIMGAAKRSKRGAWRYIGEKPG